MADEKKDPLKVRLEGTRAERMAAFLGKTKKTFGDGAAYLGGNPSVFKMKRVSSGIFTLDEILGGGWPFSRIVLVSGKEGSGKTTLGVKMLNQLSKLCSKCRLHKMFCQCEDFEPCRGMFVDQEADIDMPWFKKMGFDPEAHLIVRPKCGEDAVDVISTAVEENAVDAIVLNSIAATTPAKDIEIAAGESAIGIHAKLMNQAMRKWENAFIRLGDQTPLIFCTNQHRERIGVTHGDPTTLPGGIAQLFANSVYVRLVSAKSEDKGGITSSIRVLSGSTPRNKVYTPKLEFSCRLVQHDHDGWKAGQIINAADLYKKAKSLNLCGHTWTTGRQIIKPKKEWNEKDKMKAKMGGKPTTPEVIKVRIDAEMIDILNANEELEDLLWAQVLEAELT